MNNGDQDPGLLLPCLHPQLVQVNPAEGWISALTTAQLGTISALAAHRRQAVGERKTGWRGSKKALNSMTHQDLGQKCRPSVRLTLAAAASTCCLSKGVPPSLSFRQQGLSPKQDLPRSPHSWTWISDAWGSQQPSFQSAPHSSGQKLPGVLQGSPPPASKLLPHLGLWESWPVSSSLELLPHLTEELSTSAQQASTESPAQPRPPCPSHPLCSAPRVCKAWSLPASLPRALVTLCPTQFLLLL